MNHEQVPDAHEVVFGLRAIPDYRIEASTLLVSFGADFLETWVSPVAYSHRFSVMRTLRDGRMGRFVYVGPRLSMTAANADEFLRVPPGGEAAVAAAILGVMVEKGRVRGEAERLKPLASRLGEMCGRPGGVPPERIEVLAREFAEAKGSVALAGPSVSGGPSGYAAALAAALLNYAAGRIGRTVDFARPHALGSATPHAQVEKALAALTPEDFSSSTTPTPPTRCLARPRCCGEPPRWFTLARCRTRPRRWRRTSAGRLAAGIVGRLRACGRSALAHAAGYEPALRHARGRRRALGPRADRGQAAFAAELG
jgi:anaerobic selenocysteine-containing dehydrogenase